MLNLENEKVDKRGIIELPVFMHTFQEGALRACLKHVLKENKPISGMFQTIEGSNLK